MSNASDDVDNNMAGNVKHSANHYDRCFLSYSGAGLPLNMVSEVSAVEVQNRNTFFGANYDESGRLMRVHKLVYGSIELSHEYVYDCEGKLLQADVCNVDDESRRLFFDATGNISGIEELED